MYRKVEATLVEWKNRKKLKPLLLMGARQVGKTWLMKNLGKNHFKNTIYINFEKELAFVSLFEQDLDVERILKTINLIKGESIIAGETLLIFDEIQEAPKALTSLKYFVEEKENLHIIAAGSLLGVSLDKASFPVGKVEFLKINPLCFEEFLKATQNENLWELITQNEYNIIASFKNKYIDLLRKYYLVGGMPEVVEAFVNSNQNFIETKRIQQDILNAYIQDFAKHAPANLVTKIISVWESVAHQLAKENKKFVYGLIKSGARAREYEDAIDWLVNYGLIHKINNIHKIAFPLQAYRDLKSFKLYTLDVGLLSCLANINPMIILNNNEFFEEFKGALTEQFALQELIANSAENLCYWTSENGGAEVDFIFENNGKILPLEIKANENLQAKSLKIFYDKHPKIKCYRSSLSNYREESWLTNIPLYCLSNIISSTQ